MPREGPFCGSRERNAKQQRPVIRWGLLVVLLALASGCCPERSGKVLFRDTFDDRESGWGADERRRFERNYSGGEYTFTLGDPDWFAWAHPGRRFADASIEVEAYVASEVQDGNYGLLCRHRDLDNFYYFAISPDGFYGVFRMANGNWDILTGGGKGMVPSPAIRTGAEVNTIQAVCQGKQLSLYVNGELLQTVIDETHRRGDVGMGVGSGARGGIRVHFDNFVVRVPSGDGSSDDTED